MNKSELRSVYLEKRRDLSSVDISLKSRRIADRLFAEFDLTQMKTIHCFISIPRLGEIDTSLIYERIWSEFPQVLTVAPRMETVTGEIESLTFGPGSELEENRWGIREPEGSTIVDPAEIDAVIVPVLCYDRSGNRIGYGKGFYDRFLLKCRSDCRKIGLSFFGPVDKIDGIGEYDVPLDHCLTPDTSYTFSRRL